MIYFSYSKDIFFVKSIQNIMQIHLAIKTRLSSTTCNADSHGLVMYTDWLGTMLIVTDWISQGLVSHELTGNLSVVNLF